MDPTLVSIICKRTVVSTKPVEAGKFFPLSVFDHYMENKHTRMVYYYKTSSSSSSSSSGELTKKLRESLSEMLTHFPIVTGRLVRDDDDDERGGQYWKVKCNDAGVRMVEAKAKGSVEGWLKSVDREKELMLVYWEDMLHIKTYYWSTFYVQLTEFEEGGLAIGLSCTHLLADPTCATMFIKAWADISLGHKMITPPTFHSLLPRSPENKKPNNHPYMELINHYKSSIEKPISLLKEQRYTTISLGFSDHMVQACMSMAQPTGASSPSPSPSLTPFEALSALFWVTLSKIKGLRNGLVDMSICLDMRKILGLDQGYFGNCTLYNKVHTEENLGENKFSHAACAIRDVMAKMDNEATMDLIEWLENNGVDSSPTVMNGHDLICASLECEDPYLTVFDQGWLKPLRVSCYIEPVLGGQVLILSAPHEVGPSGRVAMVTLKEEEAIMLCEDALILQLSPTILMN